MNQITTRYITENGACYEQYVITDPEAKTALTITPERGGMITSFTLDGEEFVWTRRPNFSECNRPRFGVPVLFPSCGNPDNGVHIFDGKAYPMETHGFADLCAWEVDSVGPDGVTSNGKTIPAVESVSWTPRAELGNGTPVDKTQSKGTAYKIGNLVLISLSITFAGPYSGDQALYLTDLPYNLKYGTYPYGDYFNKLVTNRFMGCVYSSGDGYIMIRRMEAAADNSIKNNYGNDVMYQTIYEGNFIAEIA